MATIGKNANEIERADVPRGLVHQRRALFAGETTTSIPNYATPLELPSTSLPGSRRESLNERELIYHEQRRRHLSIEVTRLHAPADLVRRSPDDDVSQLQRRVVSVRNPVNLEPTITVNEVRGQTPNQRTLSVNRVFPIVSIRVGEQAVSLSPHSDTTDWYARAPSASIFRAPGSGPVHKNFSSTPTKLNEIRPIEHIDTVSYDKRPTSPPRDYHVPVSSALPPVKIVRKMPSRQSSMDVHVFEKRAAREVDDIYRRDDDVETEIARKEAELEKAKLVINQLSHDLEKLERDRKVIDDSVIEEEDLSLSALEDGESENEREKKVVMDAEEILRECNRMMIQLQEEEDADQELLEKIQRGESSEDEIQLEILRLQKQVAELNAMGVELPALLSAKQGSHRSKEDTSQIVSLKDQAVMFSTGGAAARQEALISRLERELTDAQTCNLRLNAQLGTLANNNESTLKKEYTELNKTLKERNDELDQLRKKVQKAEKDRQQWDSQKKQLESKLPVDVQLLLAQKKELTLQLDREQNEKHELFMQINHYIAQLAESGDSEALKDEMNSLQKRYKELQERSALLEQDLSRSKTEADVTKRSFETEKRQLQAEAEDARKELDMKAAALQSLMLAKQDDTRLELLREENKRMQSSVEELQTSLREAQIQMAQQLTNKLDQFHTNSSNAAQEDLQRRLNEAETRLRVAHDKAELVETEKKQLQQSLDAKSKEISAMNEQIRDAQQEIQLSALNYKAMVSQLQSEMKESQRDGDDDLKKLQEKEKILQTQLNEVSAKLDATKVALLSAESRAVQAETDLKSLDSKALNAERRVLQLQEQLSAAGNEEKEMELLRDQLRKAEERHEALLSKHQKTESISQDTSNAMRMQLEELQQRLDRSERDHREVMEKQTKLENTEKSTSQKLSSMEQLRQQLEQERDQHYEKLQKMEKDLEQARMEKQSQKVSVAEEITTLTTMTASLRNEISQYQDQISQLEHEIHDLKGEIEEKDYENEQLIKELEQARAMADSERQTLTILKSSQQAEEDNVSKIKADLAHEKEARKKIEIELANKFGADLEEVTKEKSKIREEKTHLENELIDLRQQYSKLEEEYGAHKCKSMEDEVRLRTENSKMQTGYSIMEDSKKDLEDKVKEAESLKEELEQRLEKKLRESKEETEAVRREVESQKVRVRELEEERTRELGSNDEEKKKLLEELRFYREKSDTRELEVENLKAKITSSNQEVEIHQAKAGMLQIRLENLQTEYEEMKQVLHSTEMSAEKMKESEQMAAKIKRQLEEIESDHREKLREELTRREELERKIDELTTQTKQQEMLLVASSDTQRDELESAQTKVTDLESHLAQSSKAQADLLQNVKNLTALVESESKRIEETATEKRKWQSKAEELERQLEHGPHNEEMNRLVTENARLAGELLTLRAQHAESVHQNNKKEIEDQLFSLQQDNQRLAAELDNAKTRSEELNRSIVQADRKKREEVVAVQRELDRERQERERLQEKIDNMYSNGHSSGPNRTLSNMSAITSMTTQDFTEIDDVDQLHKMMDKQQRIIKVLRRKLLKLDQQ